METIKIGDICSFENGDRGENYPSKKDFVGNGIPFINSGNISNGKIEGAGLNYITEEKYNKLRAGKASRGDFIFTLRGSLGKNAIVDYDKCAIASMLVIMRPDESKIDKMFFRHAMNSPWLEKQVENVDNGSIQGNLGVSNVKDFFIPYPSMTEQKKIASILTELDDKISTNNKIVETSEKLMREIYDYWFVQFDFPDENGRPYKSSGGEMVYNERLKREIPKGWKVLELDDIIKEAKKSSMQVNDARGRTGVYPFFTSGDEILDFDEYYVDGFNIFLNTGGNADVKSHYGKSAYSTDTWCISADKYSYMLFIFLDSIKEQINNNCFAGSGLKHLQKNAFKKIKIVAPEDNLLRTFNDLVQSSYQAISSYKTENKKLASLRDWLLPMLMNGQIKVSD